SSFVVPSPSHHLDLHSFPTRRSSDLSRERGRHDRCQPGRWLLRLPVSGPADRGVRRQIAHSQLRTFAQALPLAARYARFPVENRSEEHTSELQSRGHLVCRLLLEKKS